MVAPYKPFTSNSPIHVTRAISWSQFVTKKILFAENFSLDLTQYVTPEIPFRALVFCTAYSKSPKSPGIHVFFGTKFSQDVAHAKVLFRGFIPRYRSGSDSNSPDFTTSQHTRWGSLHRFQLSTRKSQSKMPIIDHLESISPPPENYEIPEYLRSKLPDTSGHQV